MTEFQPITDPQQWVERIVEYSGLPELGGEHIVVRAEAASSNLPHGGKLKSISVLTLDNGIVAGVGTEFQVHACNTCGFLAGNLGQVMSHRAREHRKAPLPAPVAGDVLPTPTARDVSESDRRPYANRLARELTVGQLLDADRRVRRLETRLTAVTLERDNWRERATVAEAAVDTFRGAMEAFGKLNGGAGRG